MRARQAFAALVAAHGPEVPLDRGMALIAAEEGDEVDPERLIDELDGFARGVYLPPEAPVHEVVARLNHHLFVVHGFAGDIDDYEAPRNSLLDQVLARRRGLPILLSIVYLEVARRVGASIHGIGFPGHFLVAPRSEVRFFVDPFHKGRILRESQLWDRVRHLAGGAPVSRATFEQRIAPVNHRTILLRVNHNLKGARLRRGEVEAALRAVERLLILAPDLAEEQRDLGLMLAHLGRRDEGIHALGAYLERWPNAPDRARIERRLEALIREE